MGLPIRSPNCRRLLCRSQVQAKGRSSERRPWARLRRESVTVGALRAGPQARFARVRGRGPRFARVRGRASREFVAVGAPARGGGAACGGARVRAETDGARAGCRVYQRTRRYPGRAGCAGARGDAGSLDSGSVRCWRGREVGQQGKRGLRRSSHGTSSRSTQHSIDREASAARVRRCGDCSKKKGTPAR